MLYNAAKAHYILSDQRLCSLDHFNNDSSGALSLQSRRIRIRFSIARTERREKKLGILNVPWKTQNISLDMKKYCARAMTPTGLSYLCKRTASKMNVNLNRSKAIIKWLYPYEVNIDTELGILGTKEKRYCEFLHKNIYYELMIISCSFMYKFGVYYAEWRNAALTPTEPN